MRLVDAAVPRFARHETFHPRYGWFRKAYAQVAANPRAFFGDDAPVRIGVGKNMVRAIRFWGLASKLIEEDPRSANPRSPDLMTTPLGDALFGSGGWDEYMEDPGTLWLLHWLLLVRPCHLPVWWLAFNDFHAVEFTEDELFAAVSTQLDLAAEWRKPHPSSIKKDVGALLRTYAPPDRRGRMPIDDILDCPLRELSLISRPTTGRYRFAVGTKITLPPAILTYSALDYLDRNGIGGSTVTLSRVALAAGSPGRVFKLSESEMLAALEETARDTPGLDLVSATGGIQLAWSDDRESLKRQILDDYHGIRGTTVPVPKGSDQLALAAVGDL